VPIFEGVGLFGFGVAHLWKKRIFKVIVEKLYNSVKSIVDLFGLFYLDCWHNNNELYMIQINLR
jgi:hypothetical protein